MSSTHVHMTYDIPRGDEVDILTMLIFHHKAIENFNNNTHEGCSLTNLRITVNELLTPELFTAHSVCQSHSILWVSCGSTVRVGMHDCEANIGYDSTEETFKGTNLVAVIHWSGKPDYPMSVTAMFPFKLFGSCKIFDQKHFATINTDFREFYKIVNMNYDADATPIAQPATGVIHAQRIHSSYDGDPKTRERCSFFAQINSRDLLVAYLIKGWKARLLRHMSWYLMSNSQVTLLTEILKNIQRVEE